jgi:hypothetical protein
MYEEITGFGMNKNGTYPWSFVIEIFRNGLPSHEIKIV